MKEKFIKDSPTIVKVGRNQYKIYRDFNPIQSVIQMIAFLEITDLDSGEKQTFQTPTPGWKFEKV